MTYKESFDFCISELKSAGITEAKADTRLLFFYILNVGRNFLFMNAGTEIPDDDLRKLEDAISLRKTRVPLQHITGFQNFMGLEFKVSNDVLIPRFDTEILAEEAMLLINDGDKVLDLCTGSGCIIISLINYKNDLQAFASDISDKALMIARENAAELCKPKQITGYTNVSDEIDESELELCKHGFNSPTFIKSDLFTDINEKDFDVIVSNPPYIRTDVVDKLSPEVRDHDPRIALDGGEDGLKFYRRIIADAKLFLRKGGYLVLEIADDMGEDVKALFNTQGYSDVKIIKDLSKKDRVVSGRYLCLTD